MTARRTATDSLLPHIALGLLDAGPRHGYGLYQDFVEAFGSLWRAGRSKFYATLADLQAAGHLTAEMEPQPNSPPRKVYALTDSGRAALRVWLAEPAPTPRALRVVIPVKLRLYDLLGWPGVEGLLAAQTAVCMQRLALEDDRAAAGDPVTELVIDLRRRQLVALIEWLGACRARLTHPDEEHP